MNIRLTCAKAQFDELHTCAHTGRSKDVVVSRQALKAALIDYVLLYGAAARAVQVLEPDDLTETEKRLAVRGRE